MVDRMHNDQNALESSGVGLSAGVDYRWFDKRFRYLLKRILTLEEKLTGSDQTVSTSREYFSVQEFASRVKKSQYTVREWCRFSRINAEKCDTGHGEAKNWKIPAEELQRYRDHGLLPVMYPR